MVDWVIKSGSAAIYDPAFGLEAFLDATPDRADTFFTGSEADPRFWLIGKLPEQAVGLKFVGKTTCYRGGGGAGIS